MKVLIAGVTGYIGSNLAIALAEDGHEVVGTSRNPERARPLRGVSLLHRWSPATQPLTSDALEGVDAVVLLTGEGVVARWTAAKKRRLRESRVTAAQNVVAGIEASAHKPSVLIGGSAVGYYGDRGDDELTEDEPPADDWLAGLTAEWEAAADRARDLGVRVVNNRTGHVVGKDCPFLKPMMLVWKLGLGGRLGNGRQWWPWVHIDDVTAAIRFVIENEKVSGPVNVVSPRAVRQAEFAKAFGRALHRPVFTWAPGIALRLVLGEMAGEVLNSKHVLPSALAEAGFTFVHADLDSALSNAVSR